MYVMEQEKKYLHDMNYIQAKACKASRVCLSCDQLSLAAEPTKDASFKFDSN